MSKRRYMMLKQKGKAAAIATLPQSGNLFRPTQGSVAIVAAAMMLVIVGMLEGLQNGATGLTLLYIGLGGGGALLGVGAMGGMSMDSGLSRGVLAAIVGLIVIVVAMRIYPIQNSAADVYYLLTQPHCEVNSEPFLQVYPPAKAAETDAGGFFELNGFDISKAICEGATATATHTVYTEHNQKLLVGPTAAVITAGDAASPSVAGVTNFDPKGKWVPILPVILQYVTINRLVISIIPIIGVTAFLGLSASSLYMYGQSGSGNIAYIVIGQLAMLIIYVVGLLLSPHVMQFLNDIFTIFEYERFSINKLFNVIGTLILGFGPVVYSAGLLSGHAVSGALAYKQYKGGGSSATMMG